MEEKHSIYKHILFSNQWVTNLKNIPNKQKFWLMCQGSLTKELKKNCHNFEVELLHQGWQEDEKTKQTFWVREVLLKGDNISWIYARTIVPKNTIKNVAQDLLKLKETPLGLWLFSQDPQRINLEWFQDKHSGLFARRSTLLINNYPLEIQELFLENFKFY